MPCKRLMMMSSLTLIYITLRHNNAKYNTSIIPKNASFIMKLKKIEEDHLELIRVKLVNTLLIVLLIMNALWEIVAHVLTTE
jgi:hypothetical protein